MALSYKDLVALLNDVPVETEIKLDRIEESANIYKMVSNDARIPA